MANTYATVQNGRGGVIRVGGRSGVQTAHIRGWDVGVRVSPVSKAGTAFDVYATGGSNNWGRDKLLGTVVLGTNGPEWEPAGTTEGN